MDLETITYYNAQAETLTAQYKAADVESLQLLLRRQLPAGGRVLEIGCGSGRDSAFMASLGCAVVATDPSAGMLERAKAAVAAEGLASSVSLQELAFPAEPEQPLLKQKFDAVVAAAVIMHVPNDEFPRFAAQAAGMLKAGGVFICSFCTAREVPAGDTRLFIIRQPPEVLAVLGKAGFLLLCSEESIDGLGREIPWTTLVLTLAG